MPIYADKKTGRLFIEFQYKGTRYKERLPDGTTKKDAERLEVKIKNDLMFQSHGAETKTSTLTFEVFIREYFGPAAESFTKDRYDRALIIIKAALPFLRGKAMRSIKASDIERFKQSRISLLTQHDTVRKPATVEREMSVLSSLFSMAVRNDFIDYNPCSRVKRLRFDNVQDKILRREDEQRLFDNMFSDWAKDVCRMALYTALRQNDIMTLTRFQVDLVNDCIVLVQGKTKRRVPIPLNDVSREIVTRRMSSATEFLFASPVTGKETGSVRHAMQRACRRIGIPPLTIRDLRRTALTRLVEGGADAVTASRFAGHSDPRMISRYVRSLELVRKASDSLVNPATIPPLADSANIKLLKRKG